MKYNLLYFSFLVSFALNSAAQPAVDFSGTWIQDNTKSDPQYKDYVIKLTISQTPQTIVINTAFCDKDGKELSSNAETYNLDGKEAVKEQDGAVEKASASWSADKKSLITKVTRTNAGEVYGSITSYSLTDKGLLLTIKTDNIRPGQPSIIQVLNKKQ